MPDERRWSVRLDGDDADLADLARLMNAPELTVVETDGAFFLESTGLEHLTTSEDVLEAARPLLSAMSGIARLHMPLVRPITATAVVEHRGATPITHQFFLAQAIISRARASAPTVITGGQTLEAGPPHSLGAELSLDDPNVVRALELFGPEPTWVSLYQVLDVLEEDVGGERALEGKGWTPPAEIKRFTRTANSAEAVSPSTSIASGGTEGSSPSPSRRASSSLARRRSSPEASEPSPRSARSAASPPYVAATRSRTSASPARLGAFTSANSVAPPHGPIPTRRTMRARPSPTATATGPPRGARAPGRPRPTPGRAGRTG